MHVYVNVIAIFQSLVNFISVYSSLLIEITNHTIDIANI